MNIVGHQKIIIQLEKALESGNLSHAYLFSGPKHVGKFSLALELAQRITGQDARMNPDIIIISSESDKEENISKKPDIKIESIRELERKLYMTSQAGKMKVAIINQAENLNKSAQNALLKTLEEPPANSMLILITENKEKLLPTIVSRCQIKKFSLSSRKEILSLISPESENKEDIVFWSLGRPGLAKILTENVSEIKYRQEIFDQFQNLMAQNLSEKFTMAENFSKDGLRFAEILNIWTIITREIILGNCKKININRQKALKVLEKLVETKEILKNTNSNTRLVLENLFLEF